MEIVEYKTSEHGSRNPQTVRPFVITHLPPATRSHLQTSSSYYEPDELMSPVGLAEDAKSNKSVMTTKSTREVFDLLAKLLPLGILLLIVSLMVHFVSYVRDIEPLRSISEIACMSLAATVIPLSVVFIMKTMCDWRRGSSFWYANYDSSYEDTLYIQASPQHQQHQQQHYHQSSSTSQVLGGVQGLGRCPSVDSSSQQVQLHPSQPQLQQTSSTQTHSSSSIQTISVLNDRERSGTNKET